MKKTFTIVLQNQLYALVSLRKAALNLNRAPKRDLNF